MSHHWSLCFLVSPCYLQDAMLWQWSSSDLPPVLQTWESVFHSQAFLTLQSFLLFSRLPWAGSSTSKLAGFHADLWNIALAQLFVWIIAIHKSSILVGSIYVPKASFEVRVLQPWNLPLTGLEPAFLKALCVRSRLSWQIGHRTVWALIGG